MGSSSVPKSSLSHDITNQLEPVSRSIASEKVQKTVFTLGSRSSQLAIIQTEIVRDALKAQHPQFDFPIVTTKVQGDINQTQALYLIPSKSLWTTDLETLLLSDPPQIDLIVHSLKDVPTQLPETCKLGAVVKRADPRDALVVKAGLVYKTLAELPAGSVIGTSSVRRTATLRRRYPSLVFMDARGNLNTRLAKLDAPTGPFTALILAAAGMERMGWSHRISSFLSPPESLYAVGQGAIGVEIRSSDPTVQAILDGVSDQPTLWTTFAERALLRVLEGGCSVPVSVVSELSGDGSKKSLKLRATITSLAGEDEVDDTVEREVETLDDCVKIGEDLAQILIKKGGAAILEEITRIKNAGTHAGDVERSTVGSVAG